MKRCSGITPPGEVIHLRLPMRQFVLGSAFLVLFAGLGQAKTKPTHSTASSKHRSTASSTGKGHKRHGARARKSSWKRHGQQSIDSNRIVEIQQALIREKYLGGAPSGRWDSQTQSALVKFQSDNGWQSKVIPDSRALIKLGLGPNYSQESLNFDGKPATDAVASNAAAGNNTRNK